MWFEHLSRYLRKRFFKNKLLLRMIFILLAASIELQQMAFSKVGLNT